MWDLTGAGIEPVSPVLAGGPSITGPPSGAHFLISPNTWHSIDARELLLSVHAEGCGSHAYAQGE